MFRRENISPDKTKIRLAVVMLSYSQIRYFHNGLFLAGTGNYPCLADNNYD